MKITTFAFSFGLALAGLCGCASGSAHLLTATTNAVPQITNAAVPVVSTAQVVTPTTQTDAQGVVTTVLKTNTVTTTNYVTEPVTNWTTNVVYTPSGAVQTVLSTAQAANTLTGPFDPFSGAITAVLALISGGLGVYARTKTTQVNQHLSTIQTLSTAAASLEPAAQAAFHAAVTAQGAKSGAAAIVQSVATAAAQNLQS